MADALYDPHPLIAALQTYRRRGYTLWRDDPAYYPTMVQCDWEARLAADIVAMSTCRDPNCGREFRFVVAPNGEICLIINSHGMRRFAYTLRPPNHVDWRRA